MSILIKGMKMPRCCEVCPCSHMYETAMGLLAFGCKINMRTREIGCDTRPDWCPLVEVPEHGRLIDADKIRYHSGTWEKGFDWVMQSEIALMPTVIPADKDGDNNG